MARTTTETRQFNCERCGPVTWRLAIAIHDSNEIPDIARTVERVLDHGTCEAARQAKVPGYPVVSDMEKCPVAKAVDLL